MMDKNKITRLLKAPTQPVLTVVIDTEEEFDWAAPFDRNNRSVDCIQYQYLAQEIFAKYGIVPTYVIDDPVVDNEDAVSVLKEWADAGKCLIGTHLHPWVSPPHEEEVCVRNSYPGNLPPALEAEKLRLLTEKIEDCFGRRSVIYKGGRYGIGPNTGAILADLGYLVDTSVLADTNLSDDGGPNFIGYPSEPYMYREGDKDILELPNTRAYDQILARWGSFLYPLLAGSVGWRSLMAGVLVKLKLLERIPLTPEGVHAVDHIRMVKRMHAIGRGYFNYAYHSSSLMIGGSPYVKSEAEREVFLKDMDDFFAFFTGEFGGKAMTPLDILEVAKSEG